MGLKVENVRTAIYSPLVAGIVIPAFVTVVHDVKSQITPGVELPDENRVELLY